LKINGPRLLKTIRELSKIGRQPGGGISRFTFSHEDLQARKYVIRLMHDSGLEVIVDEFANIIGRMKGTSQLVPAVLTGSHIDTVPYGGPLDGAYGVLAGVEACRTILEHEEPIKNSVGVIVFTEEEGNRFPGLLGSRGFTGVLKKREAYRLKDQTSISFGEAMVEAGLKQTKLSRPDKIRKNAKSYVELHIEQGPILERQRIPIGVVESIIAPAKLTVKLFGTTSHAGTTPISLRQDALVGASRIALGVREVALRVEGRGIATVGSISVSPNASNAIPGAVTMGIDFRATTMQGLRSLQQSIVSLVRRAALRSKLKVTIETRIFARPASMSPRIVRGIVTAAESLDLRHVRIRSGAGHDCQVMARFTNAGMIFVPSHKGLSHCPSECTYPKDLITGANVLLNTMLNLADAPHEQL
jgi:hydantoinase/carbamoylase family amidase